MSLGIVFKGPEGIVLAADSRVTLFAQAPGQNLLLPATFDNATKLLKVNGQDFVGAVTYGAGAIGIESPRTAHSFLPEFEAKLHEQDAGRLSVQNFAQRLAEFFMAQWESAMPREYAEQNQPGMYFLVGGFDEGATYGRTFEIVIPYAPEPKEWHANPGEFGLVWGGQREFTDRLIQGYDPSLLAVATKALDLIPEQQAKLRDALAQLSVAIPYQFLPLQDCVDLSIFLIRTTIGIQKWQVGVRGVGGAIDVATITRTEGFRPVQQKTVQGEHAWLEA